MQTKDINIEELRRKIIETTGVAMDSTQFDTTLDTNESMLINSYGKITGVQKVVFNKKDDTLKYLFEINLLSSGKYRIVVEDRNRGLSTVAYAKDMVELDKILINNNPFKEVMYIFLGDTYKGII